MTALSSRLHLVVGLAVISMAQTAYAAATIEGSSVAGASVSLSCWNNSVYKYPWLYTTANASSSFKFDLTSSYGPCNSQYNAYTYTCKVYAYPNYTNTEYTAANSDEFTPSCSETTTITLNHKKKDKTIKVSLTDGTGPITSGMNVYVYQSGGAYDYSYSSTIDSNGVVTLKATEGKYFVSGHCVDYINCDYNGYPSAYVTLASGDSSVSTTLTFKANKSSLSIAVSDGTKPLSNIYVNAYSYGTSSSAYTSGTSSYVYVGGNTNGTGGITLKVPEGSYKIQVSPPYGSTYSATSKEVTVGYAESLTVPIVLTSKNAPFTVTVKDENGNAISGAYISGWTNDGNSYDSFWGQTGSNGVFTALGVEGRKYQVSSYYWSSYSSGVATSNICNYNVEGYQTAKASTQGVSFNFTYPICSHTANFKAVDSSGSLISTLNSGWIEVKPAKQTSGDTYYAGTGTSLSSGVGAVKVRANTEYTATLYAWDSSYVSGNSVAFTSGAADTSTDNNLTVSKIDATVKGIFVDGSGNNLSISNSSYIYIYAVKDKAYRPCDVLSDSFTCNVSAGTWCLGYWVDYNSGYVSVSPGSSTQCVEVKSGESVSKNLALLKTGKILVTVNNPVGSPLENSWVEATATSVTNYGTKRDNYYYGQGCNTGSDGKCTINVGTTNEGIAYYVNAHTPYSILKNNNWTHPDEQSVIVAAGGSAEVVLSFGKPDGEIVVSLTQASASIATKALRHTAKGVFKATGDSTSAIDGATVDIFSNSGAYATGTTDSDGNVTLKCTVADKWYAVAHHIFGNTLFMSEATKFDCKDPSAEAKEDLKNTKAKKDGTISVTISEVVTLPECQSKTFDAATATTLECTDGFSISFPSAVLDAYGTEVSVSVTPVVTPFKSNIRPATFYGWRVKASKVTTSEDIIKLNGYATIVCPCNVTQLEKLDLKLADTKACYYDPSQDAYKDVSSTHDSSSCKVTMTTNHLTDFIIAGNGNLKGLDGTTEGETPTEVKEGGSGASGGNSGSCGCRQGSGPVDLPTALFALLPFLPVIIIRWMVRRETVRNKRP